MGRKKSGKYAATKFKETTQRIRDYVDEVDQAGLSDQAITWAYEAGLMKTNVAFEHLMEECLIVALNNDSKPFSDATSITFPKHMTEKVCQYLVTGGKFFDYSGRGGLLGDIGKFTGGKAAKHYLYVAVQNTKYHHALELLIALRNYAAHESPQSKQTLRKAIVAHRLGITSVPDKKQLAGANAPTAAGAWLKTQGRFAYILDRLDALADEIHQGAPY
ncbi:hypothetical protein [Streptomyces europaeiscabiei]|uniref:hypothetical protein n=1 Tax=Streptomyces europaeiscabiei TaxID=146819 RepID=UPI0029AA5006|nr:hypothetical protein [Streptomyces europaeiscabiei]MDX3835860.1 hypothetical protein [Streptomyces europaeiscabiei]